MEHSVPTLPSVGHRGVWRYVLMAMRPRNRDPVALMDSTVVRAHQHSAGAQNGRTGAIGRSRGGLTTKLHVAVTPQWHLLNWRITAGQAADVASAAPLLQGLGNESRQVVPTARTIATPCYSRLLRVGVNR